MKDRTVLVVSASPLFADAITRLLQEGDINCVRRAVNLAEARAMVKAHRIEAIVVDNDDSPEQDVEVVAQLVDGGQQCQLIFLTMASNRMIVHHRERIENVTPADLVAAVASFRTPSDR